MTYETTHTFKTARFTVRLAVAPEVDAPADWADDGTIDRIDRGELAWFVARVTLECDGAIIASDYLGGCCYKSVDQFRRDNYFHDMVRTVCRAGRRWLANQPKMRVA